MEESVRIILDTGIWSRIASDGSANDLRIAFSQLGHSIVLPPSVLLEVLRTPRKDLRDRDIQAMSDSGGVPLASEIELCSNDFVHVVRRYRPFWQRPRTDMQTVNGYHQFWTRGVWELAAADSDAAASRAGVDQLVPKMVEIQRANRRGFLDAKFEGSYNDLKYYCERDVPVFGMRQGDVIDQWRLDIGLYYWRHLAPQFRDETDSTMRDWCGAYLDLDRVTLDSNDLGDCGSTKSR
jgi:hypothetical protein